MGFSHTLGKERLHITIGDILLFKSYYKQDEIIQATAFRQRSTINYTLLKQFGFIIYRLPVHKVDYRDPTCHLNILHMYKSMIRPPESYILQVPIHFATFPCTLWNHFPYDYTSDLYAIAHPQMTQQQIRHKIACRCDTK